MIDVEALKSGLIIFRRTDVKHRNFYCRIKVPGEDRYKTVSLKTHQPVEAREKALEAEVELRLRLKLGVPIFNRFFSQIAVEYAEFQKARWEAGQITKHRWRVIDSTIRAQLNRYVGSCQISLIGADRWTEYPIWRQKNGRGVGGGPVSPATIREEMAIFRAVMSFAASRKLIPESQVFKDRLPAGKVARDEFTPDEYRALHTFARGWIKAAKSPMSAWYRTMTYNFMLVMTNTGMRPSEARNLRWRDISYRTRDGRRFVVLNVRGKGKARSLVATTNVEDYLERVRAVSKAKGDDDPVFSTYSGKVTKSLYYGPLIELLTASKLLLSAAGKRRSTYCFRHTYATFRLSEGVDSLFLAHQMGTSVKMIQDHYGHVTPVKNAERILQGMPGWMSAAEAPGEILAGVNARATGDEGASDKP